jgi:hypothetical protein
MEEGQAKAERNPSQFTYDPMRVVQEISANVSIVATCFSRSQSGTSPKKRVNKNIRLAEQR